MAHAKHPLTPSPPEVETSVTFYDFGGIAFSSTGPRGGWSGFSLSEAGTRELFDLLKGKYEGGN